MIYLFKKLNKTGVTGFVSDIKRVENYSDFDISVRAIQHGLWVFRTKYQR